MVQCIDKDVVLQATPLNLQTEQGSGHIAADELLLRNAIIKQRG